MDSVIDAWREKLLAHEREASALRGGSGGHGHGHGHGGHSHGGHDGHGHGPGGHGGFTYSNRPQDPFRTDDPVLNALYAALPSNATVLDVGGGAGRYALPLATRARHVTVVEPSADSVEMLKSAPPRPASPTSPSSTSPGRTPRPPRPTWCSAPSSSTTSRTPGPSSPSCSATPPAASWSSR